MPTCKGCSSPPLQPLPLLFVPPAHQSCDVISAQRLVFGQHDLRQIGKSCEMFFLGGRAFCRPPELQPVQQLCVPPAQSYDVVPPEQMVIGQCDLKQVENSCESSFESMQRLWSTSFATFAACVQPTCLCSPLLSTGLSTGSLACLIQSGSGLSAWRLMQPKNTMLPDRCHGLSTQESAA